MGNSNCVGKCHSRSLKEVARVHGGTEVADPKGCSGKEGGGGGASLEVKLVLTRAELDLLLASLMEKGDNNVADVLGQIEKGRREKEQKGRTGCGWKPTLDSIMEGPEVQI